MPNAERLMKLADRIESIAAHNHPGVDFDMSSYYDEGSCGTTACIAGHAILMFGSPIQVHRLRVSLGVAFDDAREILGLDADAAKDLFFDYDLGPFGAVHRLRSLAMEADLAR